MAYDKEKIFEQAKQVIIDKKPIYIEEVVSFLPISMSTFYEYFPLESEESEALKALIEQGKIDRKQGLREKWYEGENATTQVALYKLLGTDEEVSRLNGSKQDVRVTATNTNFNKEIELDYSKLSDEELIEYRDLMQKAADLQKKLLQKGE